MRLGRLGPWRQSPASPVLGDKESYETWLDCLLDVSSMPWRRPFGSVQEHGTLLAGYKKAASAPILLAHIAHRRRGVAIHLG